LDKQRLSYDVHIATQRVKYGGSLLARSKIHCDKQKEEERQKEERLEKLRAFKQMELERLQREEVTYFLK
jgi:hypothetical protein